RWPRDWSSDVCSSDLGVGGDADRAAGPRQIVPLEKIAVAAQRRQHVGREHALQLDPKGGSAVAPGGVEERRALERRAEQAVELGEGDADIAPRRAEPQAETRSLILLLAGEVSGNRTPPRQGLPPRQLRS